MSQVLTMTPDPGESDQAYAARISKQIGEFFGTDVSAGAETEETEETEPAPSG